MSKADTRVFNRASQVVVVRDGERTVDTMAADYQGARLVEYHDANPCDEYRMRRMAQESAAPPSAAMGDVRDFYRDLFTRQYEEAGGRGVFLEYAWDMAWCDPCAADPLSVRELRDLGVFWLDAAAESGPARDVFVTRLHVRYDRARFPEDLRFQETADRSNFQGRYVMRQAWTGSPNACPAAREYFVRLAERREREAQTLARLTGWDLEEIRSQLELPPEVEPERPWWQRIWPARGPGR